MSDQGPPAPAQTGAFYKWVLASNKSTCSIFVTTCQIIIYIDGNVFPYTSSLFLLGLQISSVVTPVIAYHV
jgi:hypothetical protein